MDMILKTKFELPIIDSKNFVEIFESLGIKKWNKLNEMSLADYLAGKITYEEAACAKEYSPKTKVKTFLNPAR